MGQPWVAKRIVGVVGAVVVAAWCTGCNRTPISALPQQQQPQWRADQQVDRDVDAARRGQAPWPAVIDGREYPVVTRVMAGGPGDQMGVRPGDILLVYDGVDVSPASSSFDLLGATRQAAHRRGLQHAEVLMIPMGTSDVVRRSFPVGGTGAGVVASTRR